MTQVLAAAIALALASILAGCAMTEQDKAAREWQRAECNRIIDTEARERCVKNAS
jgi:hypothetical protein